MRILYFHNSIPEYRKELFYKLSKNNNELKFVFTIYNYSQNVYNTKVDRKVLESIKYSILSSGTMSCLKETREEIKNYKPDVVVLPCLDTFRELLIALEILRNINPNTKMIYFWEKWEAPKEYSTLKKRIKNGIQGWAASFVFPKVDLFLTPGIKTKEYYIKHKVPESKIQFFHDVSTVEYCETENIHKLYGIDKGKKIYLYYGRIVKRKGLDLLICALNNSKHKDDIHLVVAGDGEHKVYCEELARRKNVKNITFVGFVEPQKKYNFFSQSDVFVLPSVALSGTIEAWGLTVNEAILSDNVVICSDIVGAAYELVTDANGFIFKQGQEDELVLAIDRAYSFEKNDAFYEYNKIIKRDYSYDNMCKDISESFRKVCE